MILFNLWYLILICNINIIGKYQLNFKYLILYSQKRISIMCLSVVA